MSLQKLLSGRRKGILKKWQKEIFRLYPADSIRFLTSESNQFANPVGHSIREHTENLLNELLTEGDISPEKIGHMLDEMLRIRAIQDFKPSRALGYLYFLKNIIAQELNEACEPYNNNLNNLYPELISLYSRIDEVILIAFDIYSECREKLFEIKVETAKNQLSGLLRRSELICEVPEWQPDNNA
jgi:hypothetical protein